MRFLAISLLVVLVAHAQTTVYLRSSGPAGVTIGGASNTTPVVIQTRTPHNLTAGDFVTIFGVCGTTTADGIRKVKAVVDSTHFSITDVAGADIAGNGAWCIGGSTTTGGEGAPNTGGESHPSNGGAQGVGKVNPFTLVGHPRVFLDGPTGLLTREIALGTHNGLVSLVVSGNVATVTTDYTHGVAVGDKVGIWGTTSSTLNGNGAARTITAVTGTTFSFAISVADGDYTHNDACGLAGTDNCVRISQRAFAGNPWWDAIGARVTNAWNTGVAYKHRFDGGTQVGGFDTPLMWAAAGMRLFVEQTNTQMRDVVIYALNHIERISGVNFTANETSTHGGTYLNDFASYALEGIAVLWELGKDYLTSEEQQTFLDKIYNDVDDPSLTPGTKSIPLNNEGKLLANGTAQGGSSTTITLAAGDAAADSYYVNNVVRTTISGVNYYGLITSYNAGTKVATIAAAWPVVPSLGTSYRIYATITRNGNTITGYNTTFTTDLEVGDAVMGSNGWSSPGDSQSYVSAIQSDTSLTVINNWSVTANATPSIVWQIKQWKPGDTGLVWLQRHWQPAMGAWPSMYPPSGGYGTKRWGGVIPQAGGNYHATYGMGNIAADLAMADDPRALRNLSIHQSIWFDYNLRFAMQYDTGFHESGAYYGWARVLRDNPNAARMIRNSVSGYPSMDEGGPWITSIATHKMFEALPDRRANLVWPARFGAETSQNPAEAGGILGSNWILDAGFLFAPGASSTKYLRQFLTDVGLWSASGILARDAVDAFVSTSPRLEAADYTQQPSQYLFQKTSQTACDSLTGWSCTGTLRGDALISRTGWTSKTDTHVLFQARTFWNDHDTPQGGSLRVYKAGHLLSTDNNPHGAEESSGNDGTKIDNMLEFGGATNLKQGEQYDAPATSNIIRWASGNHGSWDTAYGDQGSNYAYALADLAGQYTVSLTRAHRHIVHFKKPGTEEIIVQFDDAAPASATSIRSQVHYAQNGETNNDGMAEGDTSCPGPNGCAGLDTDRLILSQESGTRESSLDPLRTYGIISRFFSPGTITVRSDGSSYTGSAGHTHRVSICGGACGASVASLEAVTVHKITASLSDTTLTAAALNPNADWTGVQTADKVALFARNGLTKSVLSFDTDHSGAAQYLIAGLQGGLQYRVTRNGVTVTLADVVDGDNSLYFEAPAGSYLVTPVGVALRQNTGPVRVRGNLILR